VRLRKFEFLAVPEAFIEGSRDTSLGVFPRSGEAVMGGDIDLSGNETMKA
jgi:hypothetical protein